MSWMDSWSRPGKSQAVPAPYYLLPGMGEATPYCRSCGRVISSRKTTGTTNSNNHKDDSTTAAGEAAAAGPQVKYCSARCRHSKPGRQDREIEEVFARLLQGQSREDVAAAMGLGSGRKARGGEEQEAEGEGHGQQGTTAALLGKIPSAEGKGRGSHMQHKRHKSKSAKGESRILVLCDEVEEIVFGSRADPAKVFGRKKNRASRAIQGGAADGNDGGDDGSHDATANERLPSYGVTKFQTDSGDSAIELDDGDDDFHDSDEGSSSSGGGDEHGAGERRKSASNNNNNTRGGGGGGIDGHTAAALSVRSGTRVRPAQAVSEVNGSVGGEKGWAERAGESEEMARRRIEGQQWAQRKEMVRCAARRGVVFGFKLDPANGGGGGGEDERATAHEQTGGHADKSASKRKAKKASKTARDDGQDDGESHHGPAVRKCEAVMQGKVVEPSYAKGNWGVRWRED